MLRGGPLGVRDFRLLWAGQAVSTVGDQIFPVAVAVAVLDAGGGTTGLGAVLAARWVALVLFVLLGGVWADRLPRRWVMMGADAFRALAVLGLAVTPGHAPLWLLAALVFLVGGGEAFFRPAYGALLPSVLPAHLLGAGNALTSVSLRTAAVIGPGLGAAVVATTGPRPAFALDAATFGVSLWLLARLREPAYDRTPRTSMLHEVREGLAAVRRQAWVVGILVVAAVQLMLTMAPTTVLLPVISRREFGTDAVFGTALAALSAGGLAGALLVMRWRPSRPGLVGVAGLAAFVVVPLSLLAPVSPWTIWGAFLFAGFSLEPFVVLWQVALQREFPRELLARVSSVDWLASFALMPLGLALTGPAVALAGEASVLWVAVAASLVPPLLVLAVPGVRDFRTPSRPPAAGLRPGCGGS